MPVQARLNLSVQPIQLAVDRFANKFALASVYIKANLEELNHQFSVGKPQKLLKAIITILFSLFHTLAEVLLAGDLILPQFKPITNLS